MSKSLIKIVFHLDLPAPTLVKGSDLTKAVCNRRVKLDKRRRQAGNLQSFIRKEPILVISGVLAVLSCLAVPPSAAYLGYLNWRKLMRAAIAGKRRKAE